MNRIEVSSSMLASVGYDKTNQVLEVEYTQHTVYQYFDVPEEIYTELINAGSVGSYFRANVLGIYPYQQVKAQRRSR